MTEGLKINCSGTFSPGVDRRPRVSLVDSEAVQVPVAAGALQIFLAAAARRVGGIPGSIAATVTVVMPDLGATLAIRRTAPVTAGMITLFPRKIGRAVILRSGQDIVFVWLFATPLDGIAVFIDRGAFDEIRADMQIIEIAGDQLSVGVVPGPDADPVTSRFTARLTVGGLSAQVGAPGPLGTGGLRQTGTVRVGSVQPAEIGAIADTPTGDEKTHGMLTRCLYP